MRILFAYPFDWSHELADFDRGLVPSHRLFGYAEVKKMGLRPSICQKPRVFERLLRRPILWRIYQSLLAACRQQSIDCIFAVNEASALPVLVLKRLGLLRRPVIVFCTGLMHPRNRSGARRALWGWLLPCAEAVVSQTTMEFKSTWVEFGLRKDRQFLIPMLVDVDFFTPQEAAPRGDYCLAVGTNQGRDYPTLLEALPKEEKLIIVTDAYNARIVEEHREPGAHVEVFQAISILELRKLYTNAKVIINPLVETDYCSGHTVLLENMALARPVIISSVDGMKDYFEDGVTAVGYQPTNVEDLRRKLCSLLDDPSRFAPIGQRAAEWVCRFSCEEFAQKLVRIAVQVTGKKPKQVEMAVAGAR